MIVFFECIEIEVSRFWAVADQVNLRFVFTVSAWILDRRRETGCRLIACFSEFISYDFGGVLQMKILKSILNVDRQWKQTRHCQDSGSA